MSSTDIGPVSWVMSDAHIGRLIEAIYASSSVYFDLETTGLYEHAVTGGKVNAGIAASVTLASFTIPIREDFTDRSSDWDGLPPTSYIVPLSHPKSPYVGTWRATLTRIMQAVVKAQRPLAGHNVKFDAKWIYATTGVDVADLLFWDSQVSSHLLDETKSTRLKERAPETFNIPRWDDDVNLTYPGASLDADIWALGEYCARDTYWGWKLMEEHRETMFLTSDSEYPIGTEEVQDARLGTVAKLISMPSVAALSKVEQRGIRLDVPWVEEHLETDLSTAKRTLQLMADYLEVTSEGASAAPTSKWFKSLTEQAVERGDLVVAATTKGGQPQWNKAVLSKQARKGSKIAEVILEHRAASKRAEYLTSWLTEVTPAGFIHTTYHPGRTVTGRLSSSDPNMQQVTKSLRPAFIPRDGHYIVDLDYSQIELRVAAFIARCEPMIQAFNEGKDLHRMLGQQVVQNRLNSQRKPGEPFHEVTLEEVTADERQAAKSANFGLLYGMGVTGFHLYADDAYGVELTEQEAADFHEGFFTLWDGLRQWHGRVIDRVQKDGYVVSPTGRVRRLPDIWSYNDKMRSFAQRAAINSPVQGMAADLLNMASASIQGLLPESRPVENMFPIGTVHDSLVGEVTVKGWQDAVEQSQERMTNLDIYLEKMGVKLDVPLLADANVGTRWGLSDIYEE